MEVAPLLQAACSIARRCGTAGSLAMLAILSSAQGAEYFVSPEGDDRGPGSRQRPWKTVDRVNRAAQPGDETLPEVGLGVEAQQAAQTEDQTELTDGDP